MSPAGSIEAKADGALGRLGAAEQLAKQATDIEQEDRDLYFRRMALLVSRVSAPIRISAVTLAIAESSVTLPRRLHGCRVTDGLLRMRFTLPDRPRW